MAARSFTAARRRAACVASALVCLGLCSTGPLVAADPERERFRPGEISIGEPLAPPEARFPSRGSAPTPPAASPLPGGNGWIGLTVDDKIVTGRLVVVEVAAAGPAARAGIKPDDQLLGIDGKPLVSADELAAVLAGIAPGSTVKVAIGRGATIDEVALVAQPRPAPPAQEPARGWQSAEAAPAPAPQPVPRPAPPAAVPALPSPPRAAVAPAPPVAPAAAGTKGRTALGVRTLPVDQATQERFRLPQPAGAVVIGVVQDLPASKAGVPPGSVIVALDNQPVRSPSELTRIVTSGPVGRPVTLEYVLPGGVERRAEVSLQSLEVPLERALIGPTP